MGEAFNLSEVFIHLGAGRRRRLCRNSVVARVHGRLSGALRADGGEGRLVCVLPQEETWDSWERHPAGEEVVVLLSGRVDLVQELDGAEHVVELRPGQAVINPPGVWHTARVHEPGVGLFITPGRGTEAKPLD